MQPPSSSKGLGLGGCALLQINRSILLVCPTWYGLGFCTHFCFWGIVAPSYLEGTDEQRPKQPQKRTASIKPT